MSYKTSYLIATIKPSYCAHSLIDKIASFPDHDYEVIVIANYEFDTQDKPKVKAVLDDKDSSSAYAYNKGYKNSDGNIISILTDDIYVPDNFYKLVDHFQKLEDLNKKFKIVDLSHMYCGPGKKSIFKDGIPAPLDMWPLYMGDPHRAGVFPLNWPNVRPYQVFFTPAIHRETIETYLNGVIYNEKLTQGYADHWLGYYFEVLGGEEILPLLDIWTFPNIAYGNLVRRTAQRGTSKEAFLKLVANSSIPNFRYDS